ncbi:helix-turn-helix domain-containing protein [Photobacterium damselae]|uniref:helix-turn-helix domain-containing protein n=1 Tax=Photobacterium damselae TaxID=38293 RepID=UPI001EDF5273|nr:helix-turn-helix transcriptional regulator [Photobacterium damselae]MCG3845808.1 helix-turn-helix transcriptional regulator [Photobacterium damselae]
MFHQLLLQYREKHGLTQQDFVDLLANNIPSFNKLDIVTLSRWENKKTLPPLKRQFQIFDYIDMLSTYINDSPVQILNHKSKVYTYITKKFENSVAIMSEITNSNEPDYTVVKNDKNIDIEHLFNNYFSVKKSESNFFKENIKTISWVKNEQTYSCLIYTDKFDRDNYDNSIVFLAVFSKTKESFDRLFHYLYNYISLIKSESIIIYTYDDDGYRLLRNVGGVQIQSVRLPNNIIKYIFKFNRIDFLSHKDLFNYYKSIQIDNISNTA